MSGVDDRVVSMTFDNAQFERKLTETMRSLDKLRQSLDFNSSQKSMQDLAKTADGFSMGNMPNAIEGVSKSFIALSTIAITTLANITSRAVDAGINIVKSLSFEPLMQGFQEYETNMNSIQTILANTKADGSTLEDVNAALDELNTYADQTIYNFSEMTRNIGTFTAAGVELGTATTSIKGIANLAAISGSNSQQASTAMYQLSQAIASGSLKLMDWNSVVNAGMGGEVFQRALFETGKAMGTIQGVPMAQTFDEWTDAGHSFRESLQDGWITSEVLTNTLQGFTGDLTDAQLQAIGYNEEQIRQIQELGATGKAAATEVKTITQLIDTVKEAIGSGWSSSFRIMIGDFEEAKALFTEVSEAIGNIVGRSADSRNALLQEWKDLGGRTFVINGLRNAFVALGKIIEPIKQAFRDIFPATTGRQLATLSRNFMFFTEQLQIGGTTAYKIRQVFQGFFSIFAIGFEIVKGAVGVIVDIFRQFSGSGSGILDSAASMGEWIEQLKVALVEGEGIADFFKKVSNIVTTGVEWIKDFASALRDLFSGGAAAGKEATTGALQSIADRIDAIGGAFRRVGDAFEWLGGLLQRLRDIFDPLITYVQDWFSELGDKIAEAFGPGDFDNALDLINVGLLGGIAALLAKFFQNGINLDFGGGLLEGLTDTFEELTGVLSAMQAEIKANAILKIAIALAVLTASLVVLSLINSEDLTKALVAVSVGLGELIGAITLLDKLSIGTTGPKMVALATGMILIAGAALLLSFAIAKLSTLSWGELAKGLAGVSVGLLAMSLAMKFISGSSGALIRAGVAMLAMALALRILAEAVEAFAQLSWGEMARGLVGVGVGLGLVTLAMKFMPANMLLTGLGLVAVAVGLRILAEAVEAFGAIPWDIMARGMVGIGLGLLFIALAMNLMPATLPITAAGLILVGGALLIIAEAVEKMGGLSLETLAKGIGAIAVMMLVLALAVNLMTGAVAGAVALVIVSGALLILTQVIKELGSLSLVELATGLGAIAAVLLVLGIAAALLSPLIPAMLGLGAALVIIGAGFALFGAGAALVAKAFEIMARAGVVGARAMVDALAILITAMPTVVEALIQAVLQFVTGILEAAPTLVKAIGVLLAQILDTIIDLVPKIVEALGLIFVGFIELATEYVPQFIDLGWQILLSFLAGIRDNIAEVITLAVEIMLNFATGIIDNMQTIVDTAVNVLMSFLGAISERANDIVLAGLELLTALLNGIANNIHLVVEGVANIITNFITALSDGAQQIIDAGFQLLIDLLSGIGNNLTEVATTVGTVVSTFITEVGNQTQNIIDAGVDVLVDFLNGIEQDIHTVADSAVAVITAFIDEIGESALEIANAAGDMLVDFLEGLADAIETHSEDLRNAGLDIAAAIADGMSFGLTSKVGDVIGGARNMAGDFLGGLRSGFGILSPSKETFAIAQYVVEGFANGIKDNAKATQSASRFGRDVTTNLRASLAKIPSYLEGLDEFSPTIRPVLDLSEVERGSRGLSNLFIGGSVRPSLSTEQANLISHTTPDKETNTPEEDPLARPTEINFEQNIYSPEALSTNAIYRNTRSQIALAKEELSIP